MKIVLWGGTIEGRKIAEYLCGTEAEVSLTGELLLSEPHPVINAASRKTAALFFLFI